MVFTKQKNKLNYPIFSLLLNSRSVMKFFKLSLISLAVLSFSACVEEGSTKDGVASRGVVTQADVDLIIAKAKAEERARVLLEIKKQREKAERFTQIRLQQLAQQGRLPSVNEFARLQSNFAKTSSNDVGVGGTIKHCQVYQVIPKNYRGSLPAILNKTTQMRGDKQLLPTLCRSSRSPEIIQLLQVALEARGYLKPSPPNDLVVIDGIWGQNTLSALRAFQKAEGLAYGQVSIESLVALGLTQVAEETGAVKRALPVSVATLPAVKASTVPLPEVSEQTAAVVASSNPKSTIFVIEAEESEPLKRTKTVYGQCWNYQVIPDNYQGSLEMVLRKSTKVRDNKQLLPSLCKSDRSEALITQLQEALKVRGYLKPSPPSDLVVIDGIWGANTLGAIRRYQRDHGLAYGQLSIEVLRHLEIPDFMPTTAEKKGNSTLPSSSKKLIKASAVTESARAYTAKGKAVEILPVNEAKALSYGALETQAQADNVAMDSSENGSNLPEHTPEDLAESKLAVQPDTQTGTQSLQTEGVVAEEIVNELPGAQVKDGRGQEAQAEESPLALSIGEPVKVTRQQMCSVNQVIPTPYQGHLQAVITQTETRQGNTQKLPTLCKANRTHEIIQKLQIALEAEGLLEAHPALGYVLIDGVWGENTLKAVRAYQKAHGLAYGQLSIEVLEHLKVVMTE